MTNIIFFGTPDFILPVLDSINSSFNLLAIVTQPDKPQGRKQILTQSPSKEFGTKHTIPVLTPSKLNNEFITTLQSQFPIVDLCVLAAYGKIIPTPLLALPKLGFLNIHPSLLPRYRGATPTLGPLLRGEPTTSISYMLMDHLMDHGPIISQTQFPISPNTNRDQLTKSMFQTASLQIPSIINNFLNSPHSTPQNHTQATYTPILSKSDGFISWDTLIKAIQSKNIQIESFSPKIQSIIQDIYVSHLGAKFLHQTCLALSPWPGLWTLTPQNKRLKILTSSLIDNQFIPQKVQLEGSTPTDWEKLTNLHLLKP